MGKSLACYVNTFVTSRPNKTQTPQSFWPKTCPQLGCITQFLLDNHYPTTYYHEGHTEDQLAKAKDSFYSRRKPILVLSLEAHFKQFVQSARFVLVWDFPTSIAHYQQDCKTMVNFKDKHSLITSFITNYNKYLLPDLHDYIIWKGEQVPPWLSHKLAKRQNHL